MSPENRSKPRNICLLGKAPACQAREMSPIAVTLCLAFCVLCFARSNQAQVSIKPADFDRLIMPCYLGGGGAYPNGSPGAFGGVPGMASDYRSVGAPQTSEPNLGQASAYQSPSLSGLSNSRQSANGNLNPTGQFSSQPTYFAASTDVNNNNNNPTNRLAGASGQTPTYLGSSSGGASFYNGGASGGLAQARDGLTSNLGQSVPRANTIDNFISLVNKIERANPRLANDPDHLIRALLMRFRLDNYYYDVRSRTPISEQDRRYTDILPALLNTAATGGQMQQPQYMGAGLDVFNEQLLDQDEKCSMYFMLSHFIDKSANRDGSPTLGQLPVQQLAGPLMGQRPPSLQAAGAGYPAQSANNAYSGGSSGARYSGPAPSFGSPATSNMNAFGTGITNTNPEYAGKSPYGVNSLTSSPGQQYNSMLANANLRNPNAQFPAATVRLPYIDASDSRAQQSLGQRDDRIAIEYGVVTLPNQDNAAIVLNRVLLGLLAASTPPQSIRQLAALIYPTQSLTQTPKLDEEIDPLFAVTLADLWAISAIPKAGKPFDYRMLGDNGHWNDTMCPTIFTLERSNSIRFTTAELLGGLDGFNLGMFRRRLLSMRRQVRLSEMLRIYYSKTGFRPQFPEFGVCQRRVGLTTQQDDLHRQAENYLRLYQLSLPISDQEIAVQINRLDAFRETARQAAINFTPQDLCALDSQSDLYPMSGQDQCEISRADVVSVLDSSPQANQPFMQLVVAKLAQKLGLSHDTNSFSILTNQQDTTGYAGAYTFNAIVRNSTNLGEIGCALVHDSSSAYQGGQVTEPTRLVEMFERALVNLDSEYLARQNAGSNTNYRQSNSYVSTWFNGASSAYGLGGSGNGGPRNTGGAKVLIWFNYGPQTRPSQLSNGPSPNWGGGQVLPFSSSSSSQAGDNEYKFYEAKKYLRENFRGAAILAVSPSREDVKPFVYDEERDIFTDIPSGNNGLSSLANAEFYPPSSSAASGGQDPNAMAMLAGPVDQLVNKLLQRMCTIPALFQYPMCFRVPSDNVMSVGYISPGRKQYWMMSPKTFFASRSVRLVFKVDGGRMRVCFGRKPNPDETALRNQQQNQQYQSPIQFQSQQQQQQQSSGQGGQVQLNSQTTPLPPKASSDDYYTGLEYGVCKDVAQGQDIDFMISDPCYKKSISECEPFYFVLREMSQPGEGDPNYMCRDEGCKRFDQAKFAMFHTGVSCSSALPTSVHANWSLIMISLLAASVFYFTSSTSQKHNNNHNNHHQRNNRQMDLVEPASKKRHRFSNSITSKSLASGTAFVLFAAYVTILQQAAAQQQAGVYDFGQNRYGEKRGNFTPSEVLSIILIVMLNLAGLALAIGLCFYVTKRARRNHSPVAQEDY